MGVGTDMAVAAEIVGTDRRQGSKAEIPAGETGSTAVFSSSSHLSNLRPHIRIIAVEAAALKSVLQGKC